MRTKSSHTIDIVFSLALFCAFAASVLLVLMTGAGVYRGAVKASKQRFEERVCVGYIATKVRYANTLGAVSTEQYGDGQALVLSETIDGVRYSTYIYMHNGYVHELFCEAGLGLPPDDSDTRIAAARSLDFEFVQSNLLKVTCVGTGGGIEQMFLSVCDTKAEGLK